MTNVTPIDNPRIPDIDVKKIIQTIRDISRLASFRQNRSDVLQERALRVSAYLNNIDKTMRESFPVLLTALNGATGQSYFDALAELNDALARNDLTAQDREMVGEEVVNIKRNIEAMLEGVEAKFTDRSRFLENEVRSLYRVEIDERADEPLKVARARKTRILVELNDHSLSKAKAEQQRDSRVQPGGHV